MTERGISFYIGAIRIAEMNGGDGILEEVVLDSMKDFLRESPEKLRRNTALVLSV